MKYKGKSPYVLEKGDSSKGKAARMDWAKMITNMPVCPCHGLEWDDCPNPKVVRARKRLKKK